MDLCEVFLGWFSLCLAEWVELGNQTGLALSTGVVIFQSGALKDSKPLRFLLDNLFSSVRVALFGNPCVLVGAEFSERAPTYLPTDTTTL